MVKGGLVGQLKKGFKKIVLVTSTMMFLNSLLGCPTPLPINNPPKVELNLDYTSGSAPLEIRIQVDGTDLDSTEAEVILQTNAMRSNPKVGIASATIDSNLDPRIAPTTVLDLSKLINTPCGPRLLYYMPAAT